MKSIELTRKEIEYLQGIIEYQIVRIEFLKAEKKVSKQLDLELKVAKKVQSKLDLFYEKVI